MGWRLLFFSKKTLLCDVDVLAVKLCGTGNSDLYFKHAPHKILLSVGPAPEGVPS
jgi:hypothetical protein